MKTVTHLNSTDAKHLRRGLLKAIDSGCPVIVRGVSRRFLVYPDATFVMLKLSSMDVIAEGIVDDYREVLDVPMRAGRLLNENEYLPFDYLYPLSAQYDDYQDNS